MSDRRPAWGHSLPVTVWLMAPFDLLASLAMDIYLPALPLMPAALGTSPTVVQWSLTMYLLGLGLGQLLFGPVADRVGRRPVLLGGGLVFAVASCLLALTMSATGLLAFRLLQALGASAALVATFATVRDVYAGREESTTIYGVFSAMLAFVPALAPVAGALIVAGLGWRWIFGCLALLTLPPLVHAGLRWPETRPACVPAPGATLAILQTGRFWRYTLAFGTAMGTFFVFFSIAPHVLIVGAGYSGLRFSLAFATVALVMIATARFAARCAARWGIDGCVRRGMGLLLAGAGALVACAGLGPAGFATLVLPMWVMAVGIVLTVSVTANGALAGFDDHAGTAVAFYFAGQSVIVGVLGTAAVLAFGAGNVWPLAVYPTVLAITVLVLVRPR